MTPHRAAATLVCLSLLAACTRTPSSSAGSLTATPSPRPTAIPAPTPIPTLTPGDASRLILVQDPSASGVFVPSWSVIPAAGGHRTSIGEAEDAQWSPGGTRVYLEQTASDCRTQIVSIRPDGSDRRVLPFDLRIGDGGFWWSPDGRHIAFLRYHDPVPCNHASAGLPWDVWVMDADGSHQHRVAGSYGVPAWTPDSSRLLIVYSGVDPGGDSMQLVDLTGAVLAAIDPKPGVGFESPAFSPNGSALAYDHFDENGSETVALATPTLTDTALIVIGPPGAKLVGPAPWSPDSRDLIIGVQADDNTGQKLRIQDRSGNGAALLLTPTWADDEQAAWSPSGRSIVVTRGGLSDQILVLDAATATTVATLGEGTDPQWQPIAVPSLDAP